MSDLIRTTDGWTYAAPGPCPCGESAAWHGWAFCRCAGAEGGGHPSWRCKGCDRVRTLGCLGAVEVDMTYRV